MSTAEMSVVTVIYVLLNITIAVGAWLCFKRTRVRGFLFLAAILILWQPFEIATTALAGHFVDQVLEGKKPWLFPFSLMVRLDEVPLIVGPDDGLTGCQMYPGEFLTKFHMARMLLWFALLAISFILIARSLKRKRTQRQVP